MHTAFRGGQFWPQRTNRYAFAGFVFKRINIRASFAEPKMFNQVGALDVHLATQRQINILGSAVEVKQLAAGQPTESRGAAWVRTFGVQV